MQDEEWYLVIGRQRVGPVTEADLAARLGSGEINGQTLIWTEGQDGWLPLATRLPGLAPAPPPAGPGAPQPDTAAPPATARAPAPAPVAWTEAPKAPAGVDWTDTQPHPWRRYFARQMDSLFLGIFAGMVVFMIVGAIWPEVAQRALTGLEGPLGQFLLGTGMQLAMMPISAVFVGLTGSTPGKWLFGVKVVGEDGRPIGVTRALAREFGVFVVGFGLGLPLISLVALLTAHGRLQSRKITIWDERGHFVVVHRDRAQQTRFTVIGGVILAGAVLALVATSLPAMMPPGAAP